MIGLHVSDAQIAKLIRAEEAGRPATPPSHVTRCRKCTARLDSARAEARVIADIRELKQSRKAVQHMVEAVDRRLTELESGGGSPVS